MDTREIRPKFTKMRYFKIPLCWNFLEKVKIIPDQKNMPNENDLGS
jgi:hypothetical protein